MLLGLAACGSGGGGMNMQPGEWEMTVEMLNVSAPNMPPAAAAALKRPPVTNRTCLSEAEAKGPTHESFTGQAGGDCKAEGFSWAGGKIAGKTTCTPPGGGKTVMTMDGEYGPTSMTMNMKTATEAQGINMTMDARVTGKRIGDCPAGKENS
jgi:hypothetical protein